MSQLGEHGPDWMNVTVQAPPEVGAAVLDFLKDRFGFLEIDWCVLERRQDFSRVDYDPMPPRTKSDYTIDWRAT